MNQFTDVYSVSFFSFENEAFDFKESRSILIQHPRKHNRNIIRTKEIENFLAK